MAAPINVPKGFRQDFDLVVTVSRMDNRESHELRELVRRNFDEYGTWVQWTAQAYRFAYAVWGHLPSVDEAVAYVRGYGEDPEKVRPIYERMGQVLLARTIGEYAGQIKKTADPAL